MAIAMSSSRADPVLPWLGVFKLVRDTFLTLGCGYATHAGDTQVDRSVPVSMSEGMASFLTGLLSI